MKARVLVLFALTAGLLLISGSVFAHHSNALSDKDRLTTITGTVTKFAFTNPHVGIALDVKDAQGKIVNWFAFGGSPVALHREGGWTNKTFQVGQQILVRGHVNRDGKPIVLFVRLYQCNTGEMINPGQNKIEGDEYLTRVKIEELAPARVMSVCSGKEKMPDVLGELAKGKK
jgi:uncharacterized protein DUF6152